MYCKAQLPEASQIEAKNEDIVNLTHAYTNSRSERRSGETTAQITHPFDKTKRSLLNHLELLGLALKNLIRVPNSLVPGRGRCEIRIVSVDNAPCEQDVCYWCHSHRSTLVSKIVTSENVAQIAERGGAARETCRCLLTGWPLLAFPTTSAARVRMVLMASSSADKGEKPAIVCSDL
jgi:hypothetical protein